MNRSQIVADKSCTGKNSFYWEGQTPKLIISNPEHIKEIFNDVHHFKKEKPKISRIAKLLASGLPNYEGQQWQKHRKIINPAFHAEKLKVSSVHISLHFIEL